MVRIETVLESWRSIREDAAQAVEEFPAEEMEMRLAPEMMSFRQIAVHILQAGQALTGVLLAGIEDMTVPDFRDRLKQYAPAVPETAGPRELAAEMRAALAGRLAELAAQPPQFFSALITKFDGQRLTRLEMLQFVKEHELAHRAQLFVSLRAKGIVPATTRRRQAAR